MKIIVRPALDPQREVDLTHRLISAIAEELWCLYGGNEQLNWLEAERHLRWIVGKVGSAAVETKVVAIGSSDRRPPQRGRGVVQRRRKERVNASRRGTQGGASQAHSEGATAIVGRRHPVVC